MKKYNQITLNIYRIFTVFLVIKFKKKFPIFLFLILFIFGLMSVGVEKVEAQTYTQCGSDYYYISSGWVHKKKGSTTGADYILLTGTAGTIKCIGTDAYWDDGNWVKKSVSGGTLGSSLLTGRTSSMQSCGSSAYWDDGNFVKKSLSGSISGSALSIGTTANFKCSSSYDAYWDDGSWVRKSVSGSTVGSSVLTGSACSIKFCGTDTYWDDGSWVKKSLSGATNGYVLQTGTTANFRCVGSSDAYWDDTNWVKKSLLGSTNGFILLTGTANTLKYCSDKSGEFNDGLWYKKSAFNTTNSYTAATTPSCFSDPVSTPSTCPPPPPVKYTLAINKSGTGSGTVTGAGTYNSGTVVTPTATPSAGSTFSGWSGACTGTGVCSVTMNSAKSLTATFNLPVTGTRCADGTVYVSSTLRTTPDNESLMQWYPALNFCAAKVSGWHLPTYDEIDILYVNRNAIGGFIVSGSKYYWTSDDGIDVYLYWAQNFINGVRLNDGETSYNNVRCIKIVAANENCFGYVLNITKDGTGSGTVTGAGAYTSGTIITATATPSAGSTFSGWSGACTGTGVCSVTMNSAKSLTATFNLLPTVTLTANPPSIIVGTSSKLTWNVTNATSCLSTGAEVLWSGSTTLATSTGSWPTGILTEVNKTYTYGITCNGVGGTASTTTTVSVSPTPMPTVTISANPSSIIAGASSALTWNFTNATSCIATGGTSYWTNSDLTFPSVPYPWPTGILNNDVTYGITCTGPSGVASATATVTVNVGTIQNPVLSGGTNIDKCQAVDVSWNTYPGADHYEVECSGSPTCTSVYTISRDVTIRNLTPDAYYSFIIKAYNSGTEIARTTTGTVKSGPICTGPTGSCSILKSPTSPSVNNTTTWTASSTPACLGCTYTWSGTDISSTPAPTSNPFSKIYTTIGSKNIGVVVKNSVGGTFCTASSTTAVSFSGGTTIER